MIPSPAIEYLLSIVKPDGGSLVAQEANQILIPVFPPNTTISYTARPIPGDYGRIFYGIRFGASMVPNAFTGYVQLWGTRYVEGTFTSTVLDTEIQGFVWVTQAQPSFVYLTNVTGLNQLFELLNLSIRVTSEEDYDTVIEALRHMATSEKAEQLALEANQLLRMLLEKAPAPQPPIAGGKR